MTLNVSIFFKKNVFLLIFLSALPLLPVMVATLCAWCACASSNPNLQTNQHNILEPVWSEGPILPDRLIDLMTTDNHNVENDQDEDDDNESDESDMDSDGSDYDSE